MNDEEEKLEQNQKVGARDARSGARARRAVLGSICSLPVSRAPAPGPWSFLCEPPTSRVAGRRGLALVAVGW
jgi:hypothetical protein